MKKFLLFSTSYPYTTGIIAVIWLSSVLLVRLDSAISIQTIILMNIASTLVIAAIGFRR